LLLRKFDSCLNIGQDAVEMLARLTAEEQSRSLLLCKRPSNAPVR